MPSTKHRNLVRWVKRGLIVAFVLAVVALVVVAWLPKPIPVETAEATRGELVVTVTEDGRSRVKDRYVVSAPLAGNVGRIELHAGDDVVEGAVLARIVPVSPPLLDARSREQAQARVAGAKAAGSQAKAQIERAKAALAFAKQEVQRIRPLVERGIESSATLQRATLDVDTRQAELTSAKFASRVAEHEEQVARLAFGRLDEGATGDDSEQLELTSPIQGRVLAVRHESGGVTAAGTPLLELGDPTALEIVVDVLTRDAVQIQRGAPATITRWGGDTLDAKVRLVEPSAFTRVSSLGVEEQRVNVILDLEQPYEVWASLGEGYRIEANITIWQADDVVRVPSSALFRHEDAWAVFAIDGELAKLTPVEVGRRSTVQAEIVSGLEPGTRVIVHPSDRVADGATVTWHR